MQPKTQTNGLEQVTKGSRHIGLGIAICAGVLLTLFFLHWQNNGLTITTVKYESAKVPEAFVGFKILQISDLHNKDFHGKLSEKIKTENPDIIVITGDMIDSRKTNVSDAMKLIVELDNIAPVYYVSGNHEARTPAFDALKEALIKENVHLLDGQYELIERGGGQIGLLGIADPMLESVYSDQDYVTDRVKQIFNNTNPKAEFNVLLSHRPELLEAYTQSGVDLVFSGHAHGGQVRLPFIGGIVAPNQGFFPDFTEGRHDMLNDDGETTTLIVSRGLGNSIVPVRLFNRPEIVVVTLHRVIK